MSDYDLPMVNTHFDIKLKGPWFHESYVEIVSSSICDHMKCSRTNKGVRKKECLFCMCEQPSWHSASLIFMAAVNRLLLRNHYFKNISSAIEH